MRRSKSTGRPQATNGLAERRRGSRRRRRGTPREVTLYDGEMPIGTVLCREDEPAVGVRAPDVYLRRTSG